MEDRLKFLEKEFHMYKREARKTSLYLFELWQGVHESIDNERKYVSEFRTHEYLNRIYKIICAYFETLGLHIYLKDFQEKFEPIINDEKKAIVFESIPLPRGDSEEDLELPYSSSFPKRGCLKFAF